METPQRSKLWWRHPRGLKGLRSNYPKGETTLEVGIDDIIINEIALEIHLVLFGPDDLRACDEACDDVIL